MRKYIVIPVALLTVAFMFTGCKEKKQSDDIITTRAEAPKLSGPIKMQPYTDKRDVQWLGKTYQVVLNRKANDSLRMVKDETGQKFVDNSISLVVKRSDGSVAISKTFTKANFESYITEEFRKAGILEGLVFDKVEGQQLDFAASISLPQTDEYIPLSVKVDNFGNVTIKRDEQLDTRGDDADDEQDEE